MNMNSDDDDDDEVSEPSTPVQTPTATPAAGEAAALAEDATQLHVLVAAAPASATTAEHGASAAPVAAPAPAPALATHFSFSSGSPFAHPNTLVWAAPTAAPAASAGGEVAGGTSADDAAEEAAAATAFVDAVLEEEAADADDEVVVVADEDDGDEAGISESAVEQRQRGEEMGKIAADVEMQARVEPRKRARAEPDDPNLVNRRRAGLRDDRLPRGTVIKVNFEGDEGAEVPMRGEVTGHEDQLMSDKGSPVVLHCVRFEDGKELKINLRSECYRTNYHVISRGSDEGHRVSRGDRAATRSNGAKRPKPNPRPKPRPKPQAEAVRSGPRLCGGRGDSGGSSSGAQAAPMTVEEALRQADAEGLTLMKSDAGSTGYKGVSKRDSKPTRPYKAQLNLDGKLMYLGCYATPEEAALAVARAAAAAAPQVKVEAAVSMGVKPEPSPPARPPEQAAATGPPAVGSLLGVPTQLESVLQQIRSSKLTGMAGVEAVLACLHLNQYRDAFEEEGYDDPEYMAVGMPEDEMKLMCVNTKMKAGHASKLCLYLQRVRAGEGL